MKAWLTGFLSFFLVYSAIAQQEELRDTAQLKEMLSKAKHDTTRALIMARLAEAYRSALPDSALSYGQRSLSLAKQIKFPKGEVKGLIGISVVQRELGNYSVALDNALRAFQIATTNHCDHEIPICLIRIGNVYLYSRNNRVALNYYFQADQALEKAHDAFFQEVTWIFLASSYEQLHILDSAFHFEQMAYSSLARFEILFPLYYRILGNIQAKSGQSKLALDAYRQGIRYALAKGDLRTASNLFISAASVYRKMNLIDSAIHYAKQGLSYGQNLAFQNQIIDASVLLANLYEQKDNNQSIFYYRMASAAKDSMYSAGRLYSMQSVRLNEQERQHETEAAKTAYQNNIKQLSLLAGLGAFLTIAFFLYRNNRQKQKANQLLNRQKLEIENAMASLKATQKQLIQSEKMASLGELTAGIAHEIQNPLNFVNNFSEVNSELLDEMNKAWEEGNLKEARTLSEGIKQNLDKINHHGRRADAIVKGMLLHSRTSLGQKEPVDINSMVEEYLRLSYHGMRAKDPQDAGHKSFDAKITTELDESLGKVNIVPQDIARVLVNLFNNAFYSVHEKKKGLDGEYEPTVIVSTKGNGKKVEIRVRDNGLGIPQKITDKIFQPFFTTKPTGSGTGLGLSMSYDIITKEHEGKISLDSVEGEYAEFTISIPKGN